VLGPLNNGTSVDRGNVFRLMVLWNLPDLTNRVQQNIVLSQSERSTVSKVLIDGKWMLLKQALRGISDHFVQFQLALHARMLSLRVFERLQELLSAIPVGYFRTADAQPHLLYAYYEPALQPLPITKSHESALLNEVSTMHDLGFCHLDLTRRNIVQDKEGKLHLVDFETVCRIGEVCQVPVPPESSDNVKAGKPVTLKDDERLWNLLRVQMFGTAIFACFRLVFE